MRLIFKTAIKWENITHKIGPFNWISNEWKIFDFQPVKFKYFQILQDSTTNDYRGYHYFHLGSIELYGKFVNRNLETTYISKNNFAIMIFPLFLIFI